MIARVGDSVLVEWEDSYGCSARWEEIPDGGDPEAMLCRSLGWISRKTNKVVVVVPDWAENERLGIKQGCGDMVIPLRAIRRIRKVRC